MDRIRDLTGADGRDDELLTSTSGGLFDTQYLSGDPPTSYLASYEQPQYVLRNKKSGLEMGGSSGTTSTVPDGDHQALAVVTDCRVVFLVGRAGGDRVETVDHDEIVEARAESDGLMTSALLVEAVDGTRLRFACRGDVSAVADYVDEAAAAWATASRLVEEAGEQIDTSRRSLEEKEFADARAVLADVSEKVARARRDVSTLGDGATAALESRAGRLIDRLHQLEQEIAATKGAHHHAAAQDAWKADHDFERAASEYERGAEEYERALEAAGDSPSDEALALRLKGLVRERAVLRAAPMADARAAREVAMAADDPEEAAAEWETALACYREAATLDWGEHDGDFFVERERARQRAGEATTEALDAHTEAGQRWSTAGDKIVRNGRRREARQAYQRAEDHFLAARDIAEELQPDRLDALEEHLTALDKRKAGEVTPSVEPAEPTLSVEAVADKLDGNTGEASTDPSEDASAVESDGEVSDPKPAISRLDPDKRTEPPTPPAPSERVDDSVEREPAIRERSTTDAEPTPADGGGTPITERETRIEADDGMRATAGPGGSGGGGVTGAETLADTVGETPLGGTETAPETDESAALLTTLRERDETALTDIVAAAWDAKGWSTTAFSAETETVYDVLAIRNREGEGEDERLLLWTVHRPDGGTVDATVVRRCATARDGSRGADGATLVTTGTLTNSAAQVAAAQDVTVVDRDQLAAELVALGLTDRLDK